LKGGKMVWRKKEEVPIQKSETDIETQMAQIKEKLKELETKELETKEPLSPVKSKRTQVVRELPMQPVRSYKDEDGVLVELITIEEALNLIVNA